MGGCDFAKRTEILLVLFSPLERAGFGGLLKRKRKKQPVIKIWIGTEIRI